MDKVAHQQLIEQLKPVVNEPEFDSIFSALTADMDGPQRFQLKAELRRLARPCKKVIDLRKRVEGHCRPYKYKGIVHYMDDVAISIFEAGVDHYRGIYTEDTYEQVHNAENNFRIIAQRERERMLAAVQRRAQRDGLVKPLELANAATEEPVAQAHLEVPFFTFGRYVHRKEERMNFSVQVMLQSANQQSIEAMTSNISVTGIQVKISPDYNFAEGDELDVRFTGLAKEFTFDPNLVVPYRVVGTERVRDFLYLRLLRDVEFESDAFDSFLVRFINGYKRRYKVNVDNTYNAIVTKGHEQFYFPRMSGVPLFFRREAKRMYAAMALETENNAACLDAWLNDENHNQMPGLFTGKRMSYLLRYLNANPGAIATAVFYTFQVLRQGQVFFYAATDFELEQQPELKRVFLAFASRTNSFKVYRFNFSRLDMGKAWSPVTLPESVLAKEKHLQRPPAPNVMHKLHGLTHVGLLNDITPAAERYHHFQCSRDELKVLTDFVVSRKLPSAMERVKYTFVNFRSESRFGYRTRVRVRHGDNSLLGTTRDISTLGMQVDLEDPVELKAGDFVELDLIQLAKRAAGFDLTYLRYEVMHIAKDQMTLHLRADVNVPNHQGRAYISEMIKHNQDEVLENRQGETLHGLQLCLRNLYSHSMMSMPLYLHREKGAEFALGMLGLSRLNQPLKELVLGLAENWDKASLRPLMDTQQFQSVIRSHWQKLEDKSPPAVVEVYVFMRLYKGNVQLERRFKGQFKSPSFEQAFINNALASGSLMLLRLEISRTGKPDIAFIANEFKYVNLYAAHKAQQLEKDLWSVVGLVDVVDCTHELMNRLPLSDAERAEQAQRLDDFLAQL